ncbi:hypothetical protein PHYPSEUDO_003899 [Phytophthora pseudosyringae]|uniref:Uncharacterized protein n=1 Tax=Phytophthora pseudosyringae TaxID=221518 RepID=A0A8T1V2F6_9STRA|nr:hypothetical protein PHYPSEUDO_003899 [Phytophthora pseudosyringae]
MLSCVDKTPPETGFGSGACFPMDKRPHHDRADVRVSGYLRVRGPYAITPAKWTPPRAATYGNYIKRGDKLLYSAAGCGDSPRAPEDATQILTVGTSSLLLTVCSSSGEGK